MADPQNNKQVSGWLPYGSDDPSVLLQHSLTTRLESDSFGGTTNWTGIDVGSTASGFTNILSSPTEAQFPTHDSVLGMKATSADGLGTEAGYRLTDSKSPLTPLDNQGQLTVEIEAAFLETLDATYTPNAYSGADEECPLSADSTTGGGGYQIMAKATNGLTYFRSINAVSCQLDYGNFKQTGTNPGSPRVSIKNKPRFVTFNMAWMDGFAIAAIDGVIVGYGKTPRDVTARFDRFYLGSDRGQANEHTSSHWMRNLQISSRFPNFGISPVKRHIAVLSDSIFDDVQIAAMAGGGTENVRRIIDASFINRGMRTYFSVSENGGYQVDSADSENLQDLIVDGILYDDNTGNIANKTELTPLTMSVTDCILQGGTNDSAAGVTAATFETEYKALVEKVMGENGNTTTSIERLICCTPPSRYASGENNQTYEDLLISYVAIINAIPAWWDSTYPARAGAVKVVDMYTELGGQTPIHDDIYNGQVLGSSDIHYAPRGNAIYGEKIVEAIWS